MTADKPTIDELIAWLESDVKAHQNYGHILETLRAHKAIMEAERPEPVAWIVTIGGVVNDEQKYLSWEKPSYHPNASPLYGPDIIAYADRMRAARDAADVQLNAVRYRAETAERERDDYKQKWSVAIEGVLEVGARLHDAERQLAAMQAKLKNAELGEATHDAAANDYAQQVVHWIGKYDELKAKHDALVAAADAVVKRWHTPAWKDEPATAVFINNLRAAMTAVALDKGGK